MAKLLDVEVVGNRTDKTWLHYGQNGQKQITVESTSDAAPVIASVKRRAQSERQNDFRFKAEIDEVVFTDFCKQFSVLWGTNLKDAFAEMMLAKTDRAKLGWKVLTEGRDYRKFQAKHYR